MFYLSGVGLAFFLTLLLFSKRNKAIADKILAGWLFLMATHLLLFYFRKTWQYPQTFGIELPFPLVHGPFLYLYTLALTNRSPSLKVSLLHFIPVIAVLIYLIPFFSLPEEQKILVYKNKGAGYETFNLIKSLSIVASGILYVTLSSIALRRHRVSIANQFSYTEKISLQWLQYLIFWIGLIWVIVIFRNDDWIFGATVFFILFIGFFGIRQTGIFYSLKVDAQNSEVEINDAKKEIESHSTEEFYPDSQGEQSQQEKRKYQKSGLSVVGSDILHQQLSQLMNDEKLYRESELSLAELAGHLNTQPNYLSQVINEREGKNFYDYINTLRIEEFKILAAGPDSRKYTLLALAQQCGFNSKSSFNRCFRKMMAQSPSEFMMAVSNSGK